MKTDEYKQKLGKALLSLREQRNLTQEKLIELGEKFGICSLRQYNRIERGLCDTTPRILNAILQTFSVSLDEVTRLIYGQEYLNFQNHFTSIWSLLYANKDKEAITLLEALKNEAYYDSSKPVFAQAVKMCEGIITGKHHGKLNIALSTLVEALSLTCPAAIFIAKNSKHKQKINYEFLSERIFSINEYRILMAICITQHKLTQTTEAKNILLAMRISLKKCNVEADIRNKILPNVYFNLSNLLLDDDSNAIDYETALFYCEEGVEFCQHVKSYKTLGHLYCNMGRANYYIGNSHQTRKYFKMSHETFLLHGEVEIAEYIKAVIKNEYDVDVLENI